MHIYTNKYNNVLINIKLNGIQRHLCFDVHTHPLLINTARVRAFFQVMLHATFFRVLHLLAKEVFRIPRFFLFVTPFCCRDRNKLGT